jgi:histidyl-tRNA synthetase
MSRKKKQFRSISGMADILPDEQSWWEKIETIVTSMANFYRFSKISTPILEEEELFIKGTGEVTEVVEKQMYSFRTKGGERAVLRPEFTPALVRSYIEHGMEALPKPVKLWSIGPLFRYERPQKGRYRQFHQFNFEIFGDGAPVIDVLLIQLFSNLLSQLGLENWHLEVNSIGCSDCRPNYLRLLKSYYRQKTKQICPTCRKRLKKNPLRVLDCKEEKCQRVKKTAPQFLNSLCENCHQHFNSVLELLDEIKIPYFLNPYLVRGLDYYTKTVFEFLPGRDLKEGSLTSALIGGGRYDLLIEKLGGKPTLAIGGAGGIERIIEEIKQQKSSNTFNQSKNNFKENSKIFLVQLGNLAKKKSLNLIEEFKRNKIKIAENLGKDNLKTQLALAAKLDVNYSLILGQKECIDGTIILRNMKTGIQEIIPQKEIVKEVKKRLK